LYYEFTCYFDFLEFLHSLVFMLNKHKYSACCAVQAELKEVRGKLGDARAAKDELAVKFNRLSQRAASKPTAAPAAQRITQQQEQVHRQADELNRTKIRLEEATTRVTLPHTQVNKDAICVELM
jgi:hypothetical protein